jgi:hypothetical protein
VDLVSEGALGEAVGAIATLLDCAGRSMTLVRSEDDLTTLEPFLPTTPQPPDQQLRTHAPPAVPVFLVSNVTGES